MTRRTTQRRSHAGGFTLVELLLSVTLLLGLLGAAVFGFSSLHRNAQLDEGVERVETAIRYARAHAASTGHKVQMVMATAPAATGTSPTTAPEAAPASAMRIEWEADPIRAPGVFEAIPALSGDVADVTDLVQFRSVERESPQASSGSPAGNVAVPQVSGNVAQAAAAEDPTPTTAELATGTGEARPSSITFYPDGSCDGATIVLASRDSDDSREVSVRIQGVTGTTHRQWRETAAAGTAASPATIMTAPATAPAAARRGL
jgi:type II secretory pathway pseudopilin PulG